MGQIFYCPKKGRHRITTVPTNHFISSLVLLMLGTIERHLPQTNLPKDKIFTHHTSQSFLGHHKV